MLTFIGQCMGIAAPPESGAKGLAVGAVICNALAIVLGVIDGTTGRPGFVGARGGLRLDDPTAWSLLSNLASLVGTILFVLFLRAVALSFGDLRLAHSAVQFLIYMGCVIGGALLLAFLFAALALGGGRDMGLVLGVVFFVTPLVCGIILVVWWLKLVRDTRDVIQHAQQGLSASYPDPGNVPPPQQPPV